MKKSFYNKSVLFFLSIAFILLSFPLGLNASQEEALFAGGCFWCLEHDLEVLPGVLNVESGYTGGNLQKPTYKNHLGHQEAVKVSFDSTQISYQQLLIDYWHNIDPFDSGGQFCDRGDSYRPVIFTNGENQRMAALDSAYQVVKTLGIPFEKIKVEISPSKKFWLAEDYHQNFAERNALKYNFYRYSCGRDKRLEEVWGDSKKLG